MKTPIISIIVPVYKVEAFLQECIDSILAQAFTDYELILVNDGSPDSCRDICERNAVKDPRIRVIHQDNLGVTRARANGVKAARGEFITFVDGDDMLQPYALETLYKHMHTGIDIVLGKAQTNTIPVAELISAEKYLGMCVTLKNTFGGPWAKLFRKRLFNGYTFDIPRNVLIGEDSIMNIHLAKELQGDVYSTGIEIYIYRKNEQGAMHNHMKPEVIALYQRYRLKAISEKDIEHYLPLGLADSLIEYWEAATHHRIYLPSSTREEHQFLVSIMKYSNRKFGFLTGTFFRSRNPICRASILLVQWIRKTLKKIIRS